MLRLSRKFFNPLYFIINDLCKDDSIRTILIYGGKSSSKTLSICQFLSKECYVKAASVIAFRKESTIIPTTLKKSFNLAIDTMYLYPAFERQDRRYLCTNQGNGISEIILKGLDAEEKAKGIESYKYLYLDELNHFEHSEFEQFNLSLRGIEGQKIFGSWNPVDENSWVKTELIDKYEFVPTEYKLSSETSFVKKSTCGKIVLIKTTYEDNYWIYGSPCGTYGYRDENLFAEYELLRIKNYNSYKVNVLGEWGKTTFGGEFLKEWKSEKHTGHYKYDPECAIYLWFDENTTPYFPCGIFQVGQSGYDLRMIHEIAAESPNNKVTWICAEITRKLIEWGHKGRVYVGGDATSQKEDVKQEKGHDLFKLIMNELIQWKPERKLPKANPSVIMSGNFLNSILEGNVPKLSYGVDLKCRTAIKDYENTKEDKNGKIDKSIVKNKVTGVTYQPYGHFCFVGETLITTDKGNIRIDKIKIGDFVLTRNGYKKVVNVFKNGLKQVQTYKIGDIKITSTPNHKIYTNEFGFIEMKSLLMKLVTFCIFDYKNQSICKKKLLFTTVADLQDIQNQKQDQNGYIIPDGLLSETKRVKKDYIGINILLKSEKLKKAFIFIMSMKTLLIMIFQILKKRMEFNIEAITLNNNSSTIHHILYYFIKKELRRQKIGINLKLEGNGILNKQSLIIQKESLLIKSVFNAISIIKQCIQQKQNFAQIIVNQHLGDHLKKIEKKEVVLSVQKNLNVINTSKQSTVRTNVPELQFVYDIEVQDKHEYFANGVLVSNCDLTRYIWTYVFESEYMQYQRGPITPPVRTGKNVSKNSY